MRSSSDTSFLLLLFLFLLPLRKRTMMMMMMASFFLLFRSKEFLFVRWKDETRARKSTKKQPSSAALFGPSLAAFGGFSNLFFFRLFVRFKKNLQSLPFGRRLHSHFRRTRAPSSLRKKKLLSFILYSQILSRLVLNTQNKST